MLTRLPRISGPVLVAAVSVTFARPMLSAVNAGNRTSGVRAVLSGPSTDTLWDEPGVRP